MVKSKLALLIDSIILSFSISFLLSIWLRELIKSAFLIQFLFILINILSFIVVFISLLKLNHKKFIANSNSKFLNSCLNNLTICSFDEYKNYICKLLSCEHIENFSFKLDNNFLYINLKTELSPIDYFSAQESFLKIFDKNTNMTFICKQKSKEFDKLLEISNLKINILYQDTIINLMSKNNIYPIEKSSVKKMPVQTKISKYLKLKTQGLSNKHFKEFFFSGISLLFLSLIVPFSNYYLIIGSFLLIISIFLLFKKNYHKEDISSNVLFK